VKKPIIVLVSNDLTFDRRVEKTCDLWMNKGWQLSLVGVLKENSIALDRGYRTERLRTFFEKGAGFYVVLQVKLFFYLMFHSADVIWANDLDTLLAARIVGKLKGIPVIYDSHELFTEAEGLTGRPIIKGIWRLVERICFPGLKRVVTVNDSIAAIFKDRYKNEVQVVRNVPTGNREALEPLNIKLPEGKKIILQGAYIDPDRGGEELVEAMKFIPSVNLIVVGSGRAIAFMKSFAGSNVIFFDRMPHDKLRSITAACDLGLSLDKPVHDNYKYSLPNKLFDYWQAGIPVLASPMIEVEKLILKYEAGQILRSWSPQEIASQVEEILNSDQYGFWKNNAVIASEENTWEKEVTTIEKWIDELS
jgi:glycosyltransferase involved in cell wall biosynthesis